MTNDTLPVQSACSVTVPSTVSYVPLIDPLQRLGNCWHSLSTRSSGLVPASRRWLSSVELLLKISTTSDTFSSALSRQNCLRGSDVQSCGGSQVPSLSRTSAWTLALGSAPSNGFSNSSSRAAPSVTLKW